jgi:hypothetical protein
MWSIYETGAVLPDGTINWDCPCISRDLTGPCGYEMRQALSCIQKEAATPECRAKHVVFKNLFFLRLCVNMQAFSRSSEWLLNNINSAFFFSSYIMAETCDLFMKWWLCLFCTRPKHIWGIPYKYTHACFINRQSINNNLFNLYKLLRWRNDLHACHEHGRSWFWSSVTVGQRYKTSMSVLIGDSQNICILGYIREVHNFALLSKTITNWQWKNRNRKHKTYSCYCQHESD